MRIEPDDIFDCAEVIGKVFHDIDQDGYQDGGEPGLPGVRIATVKGLLITTDAFGRYHIACAAKPREGIGSNFILKVDERSLPGEHKVSTENPRVVRLTEGKLTSVDFGVSGPVRIYVDLKPEVFDPASDALDPKWNAGIDELIENLLQSPSILVLTYQGENGRARLEAMRRALQDAWSGRAGDLRIETEWIESSQGQQPRSDK